MSDNAESQLKCNSADNDLGCEFLWGAAEIGRAIGRKPRQVNHLLETGALKSARKVGGRWVVARSALIRDIVG